MQLQGPSSECQKFWSPWTGPWTVTEPISDVTYKIVNVAGRRTQVVHINRLKPADVQGVPDDSFVTIPVPDISPPTASRPPLRPVPNEPHDNDLDWEMDENDSPVLVAPKPEPEDERNCLVNNNNENNNALNNNENNTSINNNNNIVNSSSGCPEVTLDSVNPQNQSTSNNNPRAERYSLRPRVSIDYNHLHNKGLSN